MANRRAEIGKNDLRRAADIACEKNVRVTIKTANGTQIIIEPDTAKVEAQASDEWAN